MNMPVLLTNLIMVPLIIHLIEEIYIMLFLMIFSLLQKSYLYVGYLTEQQLQWLEQDFETSHSRIYSSSCHAYSYIFKRSTSERMGKKESTMKVMNNRSHLYELLKPYNTHIMSGHEHYNENYVLADNLYEHVHAPLSTLFWQAPGLVTELQADMPFTSLTEVKSIGITNV